MKKIILTLLFLFIMGNALGCEKQGTPSTQTVSEQSTETSENATEISQEGTGTSSEATESSQDEAETNNETTGSGQDGAETSSEVTESSQEGTGTNNEVTGSGQDGAGTSNEMTEGGQEAPDISAGDGENKDSNKTYYGKWKVTQYYAAYITALSREEMDARIGTEYEYGAEVFISDGQQLDAPQYSESEVQKADFEADYQGQLTFEQLGITTDTIKQISIDNSYDCGSTCFIKDDNTILILYEGVFFEAVRE